jgi:hypothetical protein
MLTVVVITTFKQGQPIVAHPVEVFLEVLAYLALVVGLFIKAPMGMDVITHIHITIPELAVLIVEQHIHFIQEVRLTPLPVLGATLMALPVKHVVADQLPLTIICRSSTLQPPAQRIPYTAPALTMGLR